MKRTIMSHMEVFANVSMEFVFKIADSGVYIDCDTYGLEGNWQMMLVEPSDTQRVEIVRDLIQNGYLDQVLLSQDVCMKIQRMAYGGMGYAHIMRDILPLFRKEGINEEEIRAMLVENPKRILEFV